MCPSDINDTALYVYTCYPLNYPQKTNSRGRVVSGWMTKEQSTTLRVILLRTMRRIQTITYCWDKIYERLLRTVKWYVIPRILGDEVCNWMARTRLLIDRSTDLTILRSRNVWKYCLQSKNSHRTVNWSFRLINR